MPHSSCHPHVHTAELAAYFTTLLTHCSHRVQPIFNSASCMCSVVVTTQRLLLPWLLLQMIAFDRCLPDDPLTQLEATLTEHGWLNDQILAQLHSGLRFWFLERQLCKVKHPLWCCCIALWNLLVEFPLWCWLARSSILGQTVVFLSACVTVLPPSPIMLHTNRPRL